LNILHWVYYLHTTMTVYSMCRKQRKCEFYFIFELFIIIPLLVIKKSVNIIHLWCFFLSNHINEYNQYTWKSVSLRIDLEERFRTSFLWLEDYANICVYIKEQNNVKTWAWNEMRWDEKNRQTEEYRWYILDQYAQPFDEEW